MLDDPLYWIDGCEMEIQVSQVKGGINFVDNGYFKSEMLSCITTDHDSTMFFSYFQK